MHAWHVRRELEQWVSEQTGLYDAARDLTLDDRGLPRMLAVLEVLTAIDRSYAAERERYYSEKKAS